MIVTPPKPGGPITENRNENKMGNFTEAIRLPSARFPEIGAHVSGVVTEIGHSPVPEFNDQGRVAGTKFDDDGEVLMQVDVALNTDDGLVTLHTNGAIFFAIGRALAEIGAEDLEVGDVLSVEYTGDGVPSAKGRNAPKQYKAIVSKSGAEKRTTVKAENPKSA